MATTLFDHMKQVQRFLRDSKQELLDPADIIDYINEARREVAMRSQCIRRLPPISGAVVTATVTAAGSGYSNPVAIISPPDSPSGYLPNPNGDQATATVTQIGGEIASVDIAYGGAGYFQPIITIEDDTGEGAEVTLATAVNNSLQFGQEVYPFSGIDLSVFPGVESVYFVRSVSILYSNYRYSLPMYSFSVYQAMIRQYTANSYSYVPTFCSQFGQGTDGSLFMYPPPSQAYQLEFDCQCLPQDLLTNQDVEAIPRPWTDAVPYFAASRCYLELQNGNAARMYQDLFEKRMHDFGAYARPGRVTNPYGRW